jgi:hypothetical protein
MGVSRSAIKRANIAGSRTHRSKLIVRNARQAISDCGGGMISCRALAVVESRMPESGRKNP